MIDFSESYLAILMMAGIVYLTRVGGYFFGLQIRHIKRLQPILETLPGCAMMAVLVPTVRQGSAIELVGLAVVIGLMWFTNNIALATFSGLACLLIGPMLMS